MRPMSLTALRNNLFKIVDEVIKTGNPVELERKGYRLRIVMEAKKSKLDKRCIRSVAGSGSQNPGTWLYLSGQEYSG